MKPEIRTIESITLVGLKIETCLSRNETVDLWKKFVPIQMAYYKQKPDKYYSVQKYRNDVSFDAFTPDTIFDKWAVMEIGSDNVVPEGLSKYQLDGGQYAVFIHRGPMSAIQKTLSYIFQIWMPQSGYQLDNRNHFEVMGDKYLGHDHRDSEEEVWVPIK